jgi:hypothetical protein
MRLSDRQEDLPNLPYQLPPAVKSKDQVADSEDSTQHFMNKMQKHGVAGSKTCMPGRGCN